MQNLAKMSLIATTATLLSRLKFKLAPQVRIVPVGLSVYLQCW